MKIRFSPIVISVASLSNVSGARIATQHTTLYLEAGRNAPSMASLGEGPRRWVNSAREKLIPNIWENGVSRPVIWKLNSGASQAGERLVSFVYDSASPKLRAVWEWKASAASGPIEHTIHIHNLGVAEIWIPLQDSLEFQWRVNPGINIDSFSVEKGADKPSPEGTRARLFPVGRRWTGTSSTYARSAPGVLREIIPWFAVWRPELHDGWYAGIEFSGRTRFDLTRDNGYLRGAIGLNPDPGTFRTRLQPNEVFDTPAVFIGQFRGDMDAMGNVLRPWIRKVLTNPRAWANPLYPLLVNNTWGSGMQVDQSLVQRMVRDSAELGLEMLHVDAGWFRSIGDWHADPKKFPNGLASLSEYAHTHGLLFGLWADWTQAGLGDPAASLNINDPKVHGWTVSDLPTGWKPKDFKGQTVDLGVPSARNYLMREVDRIVTEYGLDMIEHDGYLVAQGCIRAGHPHAAASPEHTKVIDDGGAYIVESPSSTDVSYHATRAYYGIYETLRQRHPKLLLEICNDGGRMVDFGSAAHGDYFSITDSYDPLSNRRAFFDASYLLPPAMLEAYVEKWPAPRIENFRYMLRSGMMGWLTIMQDTSAWTKEQHAAAKEEFLTYKTELRGLIRDANLYHIARRPDGLHWDGMEYFDRARRRGVVWAFRGTIESEEEHRFRLAGINQGKRYRLRFHDHSGPDRMASGAELLETGLQVRLRFPESSELVFVDEVK